MVGSVGRWLAAAAGLLAIGCAPPLTQPASWSQAAGTLARSGAEAYAAFRLAPQLPPPAPLRPAVKLSCFMTDEIGFQSDLSRRKLGLLADQPGRRVHNLVFRDGKETGDSRLYDIQADGRPAAAASLLAPGVREVQSNNPRLMTEIVRWAFERYPAKERYLTIYTHGLGAGGIGHDSQQTDPAGNPLPASQSYVKMPVATFAAALRQGLNGRQLDLIDFNACLMGNVEALNELRGVTRFAIASENVTYSTDASVANTKHLDDLIERGLPPADVARRHAQGAFEAGYDTLAVFDIGQMGRLTTAIRQLVERLSAAMADERAAILAAYDATEAYRPDSPDNYVQRDLNRFLHHLQQRVKAPAVRQAVAQVRQAQAQATLWQRSNYSELAAGLSIFMPPRPGVQRLIGNDDIREIWQNGYRQTRFVKETRWDEFITNLATAPSPEYAF